MTSAATGKAIGASPPLFDIKSTQLPVLTLQLRTDDLDLLEASLKARFGPESDSPSFFDHDGVVIDFSALAHASPIDTGQPVSGTAPLYSSSMAGSNNAAQGQVSHAQNLVPLNAPGIHLPTLLSLLRGLNLRPLAVRGASAEVVHAARACGLVVDEFIDSGTSARRNASAASGANLVPKNLPSTEPVVEEKQATAHIPPAPSAPIFVASGVASSSTLVLDKPLRSGQKAYARGGDLVVMAMVNAGAEVVADGNIHVYAPLRGRAIAGARGNTSARIFALAMEPELVSIAGIYRTSENALAADVHGKPAQIRLVGDALDKLIFEPLKA